MPAASRVVLAPPEAWDEPRLLDAARALRAPKGELRPGDEVAGLVVLRVEPGAPMAADARTTFEVRPEPRVGRGRVHLAILLDTSESMGLPWSAEYTRLGAAREALHDFLATSGDRFSGATVLTFAKHVAVVAGPAPAEPLAALRIAEEKPRGPARTAAALDAAVAHLAATSDPPTQAIVLLTDGPGDPAALAAAGARAARLGIAVHAIVFAPEVDDALRALAQATGGSAQRAALPLGFDLPPGREPA